MWDASSHDPSLVALPKLFVHLSYTKTSEKYHEAESQSTVSSALELKPMQSPLRAIPLAVTNAVGAESGASNGHDSTT